MVLFNEYHVGDTTTEECDKERGAHSCTHCLCNRRECIFSQVEIECEEVILSAPEERQKVKNADISDVTSNTTECVFLIVPLL